jgi:hypothetical protein
MSSGNELGVYVYSAYVAIPPESTATARLNLSGTVAPSSHYRMQLRVQPAANPVPTTITVASSQDPGDTSTWTAGPEVSQAHTFKT